MQLAAELQRSLLKLQKKQIWDFNIDEEKIPVGEATRGLTEMLGFDPMYVANEGKIVMIVDGKDAEKIIGKWQKNHLGKNSAVIGEVVEDHPGKVIMKTVVGGSRILDLLTGAQLPRIC